MPYSYDGISTLNKEDKENPSNYLYQKYYG